MDRPPLPREHGAWMMLYTPFAIGAAMTYPSPVGPLLALLFACTSAYFAQNALGLLLRGRGGHNVLPWLVTFLLVLAASVSILIVAHGAYGLLWFGPPAAGLFAWQAWQRHRTGRQIDRSTSVELATVGVLAFAAPATIIVAEGSWSGMAFAVWGACALFFGSSVFYVKMVVGATHDGETVAWRTRAGRVLMVYHLCVVAAVAVAASVVDGTTAILLACAYAPVVARSAYSLIAPPATRLNLKRIGVAEIIYSLWFGLLASARRPESSSSAR